MSCDWHSKDEANHIPRVTLVALLPSTGYGPFSRFHCAWAVDGAGDAPGKRATLTGRGAGCFGPCRGTELAAREQRLRGMEYLAADVSARRGAGRLHWLFREAVHSGRWTEFWARNSNVCSSRSGSWSLAITASQPGRRGSCRPGHASCRCASSPVSTASQGQGKHGKWVTGSD